MAMTTLMILVLSFAFVNVLIMPVIPVANRPSTRTLDWGIVHADLLPEVPRIKAQQMALVLADGAYRSVINTTIREVSRFKVE